MKSNSNRRGQVLSYVLIFFMMFLSWFHFTIKKLTDYYNDQYNIRKVKVHLDIEEEAIRYLEDAYPDVPSPITLKGHRIDYLCVELQCEISVTGDSNYTFKYVIIERN